MGVSCAGAMSPGAPGSANADALLITLVSDGDALVTGGTRRHGRSGRSAHAVRPIVELPAARHVGRHKGCCSKRLPLLGGDEGSEPAWPHRDRREDQAGQAGAGRLRERRTLTARQRFPAGLRAAFTAGLPYFLNTCRASS